jgi:hypothetical protein
LGIVTEVGGGGKLRAIMFVKNRLRTAVESGKKTENSAEAPFFVDNTSREGLSLHTE